MIGLARLSILVFSELTFLFSNTYVLQPTSRANDLSNIVYTFAFIHPSTISSTFVYPWCLRICLINLSRFVFILVMKPFSIAPLYSNRRPFHSAILLSSSFYPPTVQKLLFIFHFLAPQFGPQTRLTLPHPPLYHPLPSNCRIISLGTPILRTSYYLTEPLLSIRTYSSKFPLSH